MSWNGIVAVVGSLLSFDMMSPAMSSPLLIPKVAGARCFGSAALGANLPLTTGGLRRTDVVDIDAVEGGNTIAPAWIYETREHRIFYQFSDSSGRIALSRALRLVKARDAARAVDGSVPMAFYELRDGGTIKAALLDRRGIRRCFAKGPVKGL